MMDIIVNNGNYSGSNSSGSYVMVNSSWWRSC